MTRGPRRHLKRLNAPSSWKLDKLGGKYAPKPSSGPHRLSECIPLCILLTRKLQYATTTKELKYILKKEMIKVNGVVRTDKDFPVGFMDVISIDTTNENMRLLYNVNRAFMLHNISSEEATYRLCRVSKKKMCAGGVPYIYTRDGSSFRYCDPKINVDDVVKVNIKENKVVDFLPFKTGMKVFITKGKNLGCIGVISGIEKHMGSHDIAYVVDARGRSFATRTSNAFIIGDSESYWISLPEGEGIKISELEKSNIKYGEIADIPVAEE